MGTDCTKKFKDEARVSADKDISPELKELMGFLASFNKKFYLLLKDGIRVSSGFDQEVVMGDAHSAVQQCMYDDYWNEDTLPVLEKIRQDYNVELHVFKLTPASKVELPLQQWTKEVYLSMQDGVAAIDAREYKHYLELHAKFGERRLAESNSGEELEDLAQLHKSTPKIKI